MVLNYRWAHGGDAARYEWGRGSSKPHRHVACDSPAGAAHMAALTADQCQRVQKKLNDVKINCVTSNCSFSIWKQSTRVIRNLFFFPYNFVVYRIVTRLDFLICLQVWKWTLKKITKLSSSKLSQTICVCVCDKTW